MTKSKTDKAVQEAIKTRELADEYWRELQPLLEVVYKEAFKKGNKLGKRSQSI